MRLPIALGLMLLLLGTGCITIPIASHQQDADAKKFIPLPPGKAAIYIYRNEWHSIGGAIPVLVNGEIIGETFGYSYFRLDLPPGKHTIISQAEQLSVLKLTAEVGKTYFIWHSASIGSWSRAQAQLHLVDENTGRAGVAEGKLIVPIVNMPTLEPTIPPPAPDEVTKRLE